MRFPNRSVIRELYSVPSKRVSVVRTTRYQYHLYRDVMFSRHDVIQRVSLLDPLDVQQCSWERPSYLD